MSLRAPLHDGAGGDEADAGVGHPRPPRPRPRWPRPLVGLVAPLVASLGFICALATVVRLGQRSKLEAVAASVASAEPAAQVAVLQYSNWTATESLDTTYETWLHEYLDFWTGKLESRCAAQDISKACCQEVAMAARAARWKIYLALFVMLLLGMLIFRIGSKVRPCTPRYWKGRRWRQPFSDRAYGEFDVTKQYRDAVQELLDLSTDPRRMGKGMDGAWQKHTRLRVEKVTRIENFLLWTQYRRTTRSMRSLSKNLKDLPDGDVRDRTLRGVADIDKMLGKWTGSKKGGLGKFIKSLKLDRSKNETLMFHGAPHANAINPKTGEFRFDKQSISPVEAIKRHGFDDRLGNISGMLGSGLYFADMASKADCYAGVYNSLSTGSVGENASMFLARVALGCPYITEKSLELLRRPPDLEENFDPMLAQDAKQPKYGPPWNEKGLPLALCDNYRFDSVISGHWIDEQYKLYKEYAVYGPRCYPEFLVDYVREA